MSSDLTKLLMHKSTSLQIRNFINKPSHGLLITGERGSGKTIVAKHIASTLLKMQNIDNLENYAYFYHLEPTLGKDISVEEIRSLIIKLKLKTPGKSDIKRVVLIEEANKLSGEAQNALLKTLEEPASDTVLILTAISERQILPTLSSRAQLMIVAPIELADAENYFKKQYSQSKIESLWRLSGGNAGLLLALFENDDMHALKIAVDNAKVFLKSDKYGRLKLLNSIADSQSDLQLFLDGLSRVLAFLNTNAYEKNQKSAAAILKSRKLIIKMIDTGGIKINVKLTKLYLAMNLNI